eukprot:TRINITY_DN9590_c0_g1_i1.p1 TRINITY_DN9590_c0_g1~~TRINITY_DN9590_c0_g1_i1.p1  ORF type:complete len:195 (+),score=41.66 TRINITY_DN9590_c0_g1_i1:23-586(+)
MGWAPLLFILCCLAAAQGWQLFTPSRCWTTQRSGLSRVAAASGEDDISIAENLLLRVNFSRLRAEALQEWLRRYPFGAALTVQPYNIKETDSGVELFFRKKPTMERGSQDGGMAFSVISAPQPGDDNAQEGTLVVTRITEGQMIRKVFAERIVCKSVATAIQDLQDLEPENFTVVSMVGVHSDFVPK